MRVVVIGPSGSGKSTMAVQIGRHFQVPVVELDALNWQANWVALSQTDPAAFLHSVDLATSGKDWVVAGNYSIARDITWGRATHLVWLDYSRRVVMPRVIRRSFWRAVRREEIWGGNRETFRSWLEPGHPILWSWNTWRSTREKAAKRLEKPESAHLLVKRVKRPQEAETVVAWLKETEKEVLF